MDLVDISRWQFGITTVYHFIFVPLTIGLAPIVAGFQTAWVLTNKDKWLRATKFFGTLFLVNFAMGMVTGIVQEFQFGMAWSEYSRFVGDVFGAPLALEGLVAFFVESTFLGLWIFGWGRLPRWIHLASIWLVAVAVNVSAYFIIVANSFMQHPVGAIFNPETGRAELVSLTALLTNPTALAAWPHAVTGSLLTAGTFVAGIAGWWMIKESRKDSAEKREEAASLWRPLFRIGSWVTILSAVGLGVTGDIQGKLMFVQQPMKMAAAESLCQTATDPYFSVLSIGTHNDCGAVQHLIELPGVLSFLAANKFSGVTLQGVEHLQKQYEQLYGPGNYTPNLFVTYWSFRAMIGLMLASIVLAVVGLWYTRRGAVPRARWMGIGALIALPFPFLANSAGWVFTEMGRQPWVVAPNPDAAPGSPGNADRIHLIVDFGVSNNPVWVVFTSLIGFTLVYGALACVWFWLMKKKVVEGMPTNVDSAPLVTPQDEDSSVRILQFGKDKSSTDREIRS
ncbi:Cytochrome d ubiquinol oxidase subunit 1 [Corynebacterium pseudotuberculosis]|uniref:cytochrome ubiquinol oxidase subunit I n=1 Tax=Corynebacterium pseudotuberculosis TaxID=1719 RepID=UPI00065E96D8|nr:cytochrome ubiquinol oxidase subunit I [Corynebacterium pseudotuberculosis]AKP09321.1 Cytochrome d ubiquinol oxidase subunit 1 [Corynebacterium pseudotuberculosis]